MYDDPEFSFRRKMIRNIPFLKNVSPAIIEEIVYLLRSHRYTAKTIIIKTGDTVKDLMFLKSGHIDVEVPYKGKMVYLDSLNEGSCFCCYSPFGDEETQQLVSFKARTDCMVEKL